MEKFKSLNRNSWIRHSYMFVLLLSNIWYWTWNSLTVYKIAMLPVISKHFVLQGLTLTLKGNLLAWCTICVMEMDRSTTIGWMIMSYDYGWNPAIWRSTRYQAWCGIAMKVEAVYRCWGDGAGQKNMTLWRDKFPLLLLLSADNQITLGWVM